MWELKNRTPYAAERTWIRDKNGVHHWTIAVRATFSLDGQSKLSLADVQAPPLLAPEYYGEPASSSLKYDSDLGPMKPATDLTILGQAHAPHGRPTERVRCGFRLGSMQKNILVHGDRHYVRGALGPVIGAPQRFVSRPLVYESAYGGRDLSHPDPTQHAIDGRNPVGVGVAIHAASLLDKPAHALDYEPSNPLQTGPAGFGPIAPSWLPRRAFGGTFDEAWQRTRRPLLPDDYDPRFTLCAPADQRASEYLRGGELVELAGMSPAGAIRFTLPKIYLALTTFLGSRRHEHRTRLVSVIIEPDEQRLSMVWQSALRVPAGDVEHLDLTRIREKAYLS